MAGLQTGAFLSWRGGQTIARIGGTLLRTVPGIKNEFEFSYIFDQWNKKLRKSEPLSIPGDSDLSPATPSVALIAGDAPSEEVAHRKTIAQTAVPDETPGFCSDQQAGARA